MKKILGYFKPYKWQSIAGPLFKLLEATFELLVPIVVALIVDKGLGEFVDGGYPYADKGYIAAMCGVLALFGLLGLGFAVTAQYFAARAATGVSARVRADLFRKLQSLSYKDLDKLGTSTMLTRMTSDVDRMQSAINISLRLFLRSPFIVLGAVFTAWIIDPSSFGVFALTVGVLSVVVYAIMFACMPLYKKSQNDLDAVTLSTRENLTGARVMRAFCREREEEEIFKERNERLTKSRQFVGALAAVTNPLTYVLINAGILLLLWTGAIRVEAGNLSQGTVIALYNLMSQILVELIKLANLIVTVAKGFACGERVETVLKMQPSLEVDETTEKAEDTAFLRFDGVTMRYHGGGEAAIENLSFSVSRGETVGVIGGTGSGKTTLVNLIPHYYDIDKGQILLNGQNIREKGLQPYLRERVGLVPQKAVLFKGSIRDNLLWGRADATDEELFEALRIAQAEEVVLEKGGLDGKVEQGGKNFSGGQKQRLTIARAVVRKPDILILDDSASALDFATEAALRKALKGLNTTTFIVSQRTSSIRHADKIIVLDEGKAVGIGTHEELLVSCEEYREIHFSQGAQEAKEGGYVG